MPEQRIREQHGRYPPGPPTSFEACCRSAMFSRRYNHTEPKSPKPTVARTGTWVMGLEAVVERLGFQVPDDGRALPGPYASGEGTTPAEHRHLPHPATRSLPPPPEARSLSSFKSTTKDIQSELRAKADAATQWNRETATVRNDPERDVSAGLFQYQITRKRHVLDGKGAVRDIDAGYESKNLGTEGISSLMGTEQAIVPRKPQEVEPSLDAIDWSHRHLPTPVYTYKANEKQSQYGKGQDGRVETHSSD